MRLLIDEVFVVTASCDSRFADTILPTALRRYIGKEKVKAMNTKVRLLKS